MADRDELLTILANAAEDTPVAMLMRDLPVLVGPDVPEYVQIVPCSAVEPGMHTPVFDGVLCRGQRSPTGGVVDYSWFRKLWEAPLGVSEYARLVERAVQARKRVRDDVEVLDSGEDDEHVWLRYSVDASNERLDRALKEIQAIEAEMLEVAEAVAAGIEDTIANAAKRLDGWGTESLDALVDQMREGSAYEKGVRLEELVSRLFAQVPGFRPSGRVLTQTEEIDVRIGNESDDAVWRRESALLLGECKNWTTSCGRPEFSILKDKLRGRVGRVSCGFLVSWNGFTDTVEKQMLRGSEGDLLVVPITGKDLRAAVRDDDFAAQLKELHQRAILL